MKEQFLSKRFGSEIEDMISKITSILEDYANQGLDLSLRQLYYRCVAKKLFPADRLWVEVNGKWKRDPVNGTMNAEPNYKWLGDIVSDARIVGRLDWDMIRDRGRSFDCPYHSGEPYDFIVACARGYTMNHWDGQDNYVEVMVEKQALEGVLLPVCRELSVGFTANKGYSSSSALYEAGKRLSDADDDGKELHVIYLGDHDPSGIDMSRDITERLEMFSRSSVNVHRIALNMDQVEDLHLEPDPAKLSDSRAKEYISRFGESSWELDAIEPAELADMVRRTVISLRDDDVFEKVLRKEAKVREALKTFAKKFKA